MNKAFEQLGIKNSDSAIDLLSKGSLSMAFQPIVEVRSVMVYGFEALLRGPKEKPLADIEGLFRTNGCPDELIRLDMACVGSALRCGRMLASNQCIFINVHADTLRELSLNFDAFLKILDELEINPESIVFEISERTDHKRVSAIIEYLDKFLHLGVQTAIDDVGASFNWIHNMLPLKPKFLKLDKSFIREISRYKMKQAIVRSLALMTEKMNVNLIAEGIETPQALQMLKGYRVSFAQGFLLGRPRPAEKWLSDITEGNIVEQTGRKKQ
jgi:EAL domain-containing protein (putative c-di-GMP-specific phosphodiesterase class I)